MRLARVSSSVIFFSVTLASVPIDAQTSAQNPARPQSDPIDESKRGGAQEKKSVSEPFYGKPGTAQPASVNLGPRLPADVVRAAQEALKKKGYDPGAIDGVLGEKTREAIQKFQQTEGLQPTGKLDRATAVKLGVF